MDNNLERIDRTELALKKGWNDFKQTMVIGMNPVLRRDLFRMMIEDIIEEKDSRVQSMLSFSLFSVLHLVGREFDLVEEFFKKIKTTEFLSVGIERAMNESMDKSNEERKG